MVKIRLRRMGQKHRPFYRIVVAKSTAGRGGSFIEVLGTYDPLTKPSTVKLDGDSALNWLKNGAQPTETVAYLLKREGVLEKFFGERPSAKNDYKFLDKRTAAISKSSVVETPTPEPVAKTSEPAVVAEPAATSEPEPVVEVASAQLAAEETVTVEPVAESAASEQTPEDVS